MRGGLTCSDAIESNSANSNSLVPVGALTAVMFIFSTKRSGTRFTTNSPVSRIFCAESLNPRSFPEIMPIASVGGADPIALKKLYGALFTPPFLSMVTTQAMGRGITVEARSLYAMSLPTLSRSYRKIKFTRNWFVDVVSTLPIKLVAALLPERRCVD